MNKFKRILSLVLAFSLMASLTACSNSESQTAEETTTDTPEVKEEVVERNYNYLTGEEIENDEESTSRPVAIMINNAKQALPQKGLSSAQVIYEAVTEGGITRLMAVYPSIESVGTVGPVRSARDQFVEFVLPLNAVYVNIGASKYANEMLESYNYQNVDGLYLGENAFYIDTEREAILAPEHCWFTNSELITQGAQMQSIDTNGNVYPIFNFDLENGEVSLDSESAVKIEYSYSEYAPVSFTYDETTGKYLKTAFGAPHIDAETNEQLAFDNVFVLYAPIGYKEDLVVPDFNLSTGTGYYFNDGEYIKITYSKEEPRAPLVIMDENGDEIKVEVGESYVGIVGEEKAEEIIITAMETTEDTTEE